MLTKYRKAYAALQAHNVPVYVHANDNGNFSINAETTDLVDYWSCYIHEDIDNLLQQHYLYAEWVNPGRLAVYPV